MNKLQRLATVLSLSLVLGLTAFAGHASAGPCDPTDPGQLQTPCIPPPAANQAGESETTPGNQPANDASDSVISEVTYDVLEIALSLF